MGTDYYAETRRIADLLSREGERDVAARIIEAIEGGSMATEILMALRFHLQQALEARRTGGETTTAQVQELVQMLNEALE